MDKVNYLNTLYIHRYIWKLKEKEVERTITLKKLRQSNTCQLRTGLCNLCIEEKVEIFIRKAKPSTQLNRRFEVSTCRHVSPPTSIAPTSKLMKTEPNRPQHLSEDGGGVDPIPCVSTHRISDSHSGPAQLLPPHVKQRSHSHGVRPQIPDR